MAFQKASKSNCKLAGGNVDVAPEVLSAIISHRAKMCSWESSPGIMRNLWNVSETILT